MLNPSAVLGFARPGALWIGLAALPVILLYFLRMRFRRKAIGSTYLWRSLLASTSGGDALRRRSLLLLVLQVAAIGLAAFAAAGPSLSSRRLLRPGTAFLIDVSASMAARDGDPSGAPGGESRVAAAAAAAQAEIAALGDDVPMMAFACSDTARPLLAEPSLNKGEVAAAIRRLSAGSEAFSEAACADALSAWMARGEGAWQACLLTDGGLDLGGRSITAAFAGELRVVTVGSSGASVGATGLRLERAASGALEADFTLWNGWPSERKLRVSVSRGVASGAASGGDELGSGLLAAAPGWSRSSLRLGGSLEDGAYTLSIERGSDERLAAPGDVFRLSVSSRRALSVLLVGRSDPFVKAALAYGGISFTSVAQFPEKDSGRAGGAAEGADIVIAESAKVPANLRCQLLVFGPPPADAPFVARGRASGRIRSTDPSHPLSRFVSWDGAMLGSGIGYALRRAPDQGGASRGSPGRGQDSGGARVLATAGGVPVLVAWEKDGFRCLACGIDLAKSDLGLKSAFPVLLQNFFQWCVPSADDQSAFTLVAGEGVRRAVGSPGDEGSFKVRGVEALRTGPTVVLTARDAGFFEWEERPAAGASREALSSKGYIAANVPAGELDVRPRRLQAAERDPAKSGTALASTEQAGKADLGPWSILLLALCLAGEWLAWRGGSRRRGGHRQEAKA